MPKRRKAEVAPARIRYLMAASVPAARSLRQPMSAYSETLRSSRPRKNDAKAVEAARMHAPRHESSRRK